MKRHRFDPLSFIFGFIFLALAAVLTLEGSFEIDGAGWLKWVAAGVLLVVGVVMLVGTRSTSRES